MRGRDMNTTKRNSRTSWAKRLLVGGLSMFCGMTAIESVAGQEPAPLLARPSTLDMKPTRPPKIGLGAPVPASAVQAQNDMAQGYVQPASLEVEKPMPRPDAKTPSEMLPPPQQVPGTSTVSAPIPY